MGADGAALRRFVSRAALCSVIVGTLLSIVHTSAVARWALVRLHWLRFFPNAVAIG